MTDMNPLREHLVKLLDWQDAHATYDAAIDGIPASMRGARPEGLPYSLWQLIEHIRVTQRDILNFCRDPAYSAPRWPDNYWPATAEPDDDHAWDRTVAGYRADREAMKQIARDTLDLFARIPHGDGQTYLREIVLVADHTAYHTGEIIVIRRLLGIWK